MVSGCLSTKVTSYEDEVRASRPKDALVPIVDLRNIDRPYQVIGYIEIKSSDVYTTEMIINRLRKKARKLCGEALSDVIQEPIEEKFPQFFDWLNFYGNSWSAEVLIWEDTD